MNEAEEAGGRGDEEKRRRWEMLKTEVGGQKTEDRRQTADGRRQTADRRRTQKRGLSP